MTGPSGVCDCPCREATWHQTIDGEYHFHKPCRVYHSGKTCEAEPDLPLKKEEPDAEAR